MKRSESNFQFEIRNLKIVILNPDSIGVNSFQDLNGMLK